MSTPLISVIIPAHNNAQTIGVALDSMLAQTYANLEIIVVDDNSSDTTKDIAQSHAKRDPRIRVIAAPEDPNRFDPVLNRNINAGWSARNAGLAACKGDLITFQDGDDASLINRIEIQEALLRQYDAMHITTNCTDFRQELVGTRYLGSQPDPAMTPKEIVALARKSKGFVPTYFPALSRAVRFHYKRKQVLNRLFFGNLGSYPGAGNSPLFRREILDKVRFRPLKERQWPSFMGRGADRDFNFNVALTFRNSYYFDIALYLWRTDK